MTQSLSVRTEIRKAIEADRKEDVLAFINGGYDPTFMSNELIVLAFELRNYDMVTLLLDNGVSMSSVSCAFDILDEAIKRNDIDSCRFALEQGAGKTLVNEPINRVIRNGQNDLIQSCVIKGYMEICKLLLSYGLDGGGDAIGSAARMGKREFFQLLLDAGENIHGPSYAKGNTLCAVAFGGHDDIVHILLERNVDINLRSDEGTPLEIAVRYERYSTCKILIENGADTSVLKKSQYKKILGSPRHALANITPKTHQEIVRLTVSLHVASSKQSILDLINKADDWLKPYYMKAMSNSL